MYDIIHTSEQKKAFLLLELTIFNYHGLDDEEKKILNETAEKLDAHEELKWAYEFIGQDVYASFEKVRQFLQTSLSSYDNNSKLELLGMIWDSTKKKGYISEMEATAILKIAKDWSVQKDFLSLIRSKS